MKTLTIIFFLMSTLFTSGCSVFGNSSAENAAYKSILAEEPFELRSYEKLILVETPASKAIEGERDTAFSKLFRYISGNNETAQKIPMTAPVFMDGETMSFVLPNDFDFTASPPPIDPDVRLKQVENLTAAVITFNGSLNIKNIDKHEQMLRRWISQQGYEILGQAIIAGYNPPWTLPQLRRNEVLIPVDTP